MNGGNYCDVGAGRGRAAAHAETTVHPSAVRGRPRGDDRAAAGAGLGRQHHAVSC